MQKRTLAFAAISMITVLAPSCDLFEDKPDLSMVEEVTAKAVAYMDDLVVGYIQAQESLDIPVGTRISDSTTPPGSATRTLDMDITEFVSLQPNYGIWYSGTASFDTWSGDGSSPYMELTGTLTYTNKILLDRSRVLSGELDVKNMLNGNTIDHIKFDIVFADEADVTGTVTADGVKFDLQDEFFSM